MQLPSRIGQGGLHLHVSGRLIHDRVKGGYSAGKLESPNIIAGNVQRAPDARLDSCLLRHAEVHINRIQRLQRNYGLTS